MGNGDAADNENWDCSGNKSLSVVDGHPYDGGCALYSVAVIIISFLYLYS